MPTIQVTDEQLETLKAVLAVFDSTDLVDELKEELSLPEVGEDEDEDEAHKEAIETRLDELGNAVKNAAAGTPMEGTTNPDPEAA